VKLHDVGTSTLDVDCLRVFTMTFPNQSEVEAGVYSLLAPIERDRMMIVVGFGQSKHPRLWEGPSGGGYVSFTIYFVYGQCSVE
jgi:hypothetical protein